MTLNPSQCMGPQSVGQKEESHGPQVRAIFRAMFEPHKTSIDVIMPIKGRVPFFLEALETVVAQSHRPLHLIVVDDGCSDAEREEITAALSEADKAGGRGFSSACIRHSGAGAAATRNAGFRSGRSPYILWVDSDDWLLPYKLEYDLGLLHDTDHDFVVSRAQHKQNGELIDAYWGGEVLNDRAYFTYPFQTMCALFKREFLLGAVLHWNERLDTTDDWEFSNRAMIATKKVHYSPKITSTYRQPDSHSQSLGSVLTIGKIQRQLKGIDKVLRLKKQAYGRVGALYKLKHIRHATFLLGEAVMRGHFLTCGRALRSVGRSLIA
jgi:glycosyltransferase involved in cell wall biosynthesis